MLYRRFGNTELKGSERVERATRWWLAIGAILLAAARGGATGETGAAEAGATGDEELPSYVLDEVLVAGTRDGGSSAMGLPLAARRTPASVGLVPQALIAAQDNRVLGDALRNVGGVSAQTGFGVFDFFSIRGFESLTSGLVLTDGVPEPEVTFYDLYNVERVEVLKGPASFLHGGNALSGAVDLRRKRPVAKRLLRISAGAGRFGSRRAAVDAGGTLPGSGALTYRLNAQGRSADNYRDDKESSSLAVNPVLRWRRGTGEQVTAYAEYITSDHNTDAGLPILEGRLSDVPRTRSYQSPFDRSDQRIVRLRLDYRKRLGAAAEVRDRLYFTRLNWTSNGTLLTGPATDLSGAPVPGYVGRTLTLLDDDQKLLGNQLELQLQGRAAGVEHRLLVGLEVARLVDDYTLDVAWLPPMDPQAPVETAVEPLLFVPELGQAGLGRSLTRALYCVDAIAVGEGLHLVVGGRLDALAYEDEPNAIDEDFKEFSPMVGATYAVSADWSLYASAGRAFAPPSTRGRGERGVEESQQAEVGAKGRWTDLAAIDAAAARLAVYQLSKDVTANDGVTARRGRQHARGAELETEWVAGSWTGTGSYAFAVADLQNYTEVYRVPTDGGVFELSFDRSTNEPAFAPRHLANLWVAYRPRQIAGLAVGAGVRHVGRQYSAEDNAYRADAVTLLDASAAFERGPLGLTLRFDNLTNRQHETRGFGSRSVIPAAPFSVRASVAWSWR